MAATMNRRVLLQRRPQGDLKPTDFSMDAVPAPEPKAGEVLIRNIYLSLDPTNRLWARAEPTYLPPVALGGPMRGFTLGVVEKSQNPAHPVGSIVSGIHGWEEYSISSSDPAHLLTHVDMDPRLPLAARYGLFEHIGLTSYFGILDILRPKVGDTMVVSGAAGAVGSIAVQIGKIMGSRVVAIAGTDEKCRWLTEDLGADAAVNYKKGSLDAALRAACPKGIDTFFDNVGGETLNTVLGQINNYARLCMCGAISQYGIDGRPYGPPNVSMLLLKRARLEGFIVLDYSVDKRRWAHAHEEITNWHLQGRLKYRLDLVKGLEHAPTAVTRLFDGSNTGKLLVQIADEPARKTV